MYNRGGGSSDRPRGFGFTGFTLPTTKTSSEAQLAKLGFGMVGGIGMHSRGYGTGLGKRRIKSEEEYFDDDEEDKNDDLEYQPAPDSPTRNKGSKHDKPATADNDDVDTDASDDPLDAFMMEIQEEVVKQEVKSSKKTLKKKKGVRDDIDNEDVEESYYRYMEENPMAGVILDDDNQPLEYDEDGNVIIPDKNRIIDPLPPIDHWEIEYQKFNKNFYEEHPDIAKLSESEVQELRQALGIRVSGIQAAYKPVSSFAHFGFDNELIKAIQKMEFTQPTPIQAQGIPVTLSGRDMIGVAKTGSGKTAAFLWPLLVHIMAQGELKKGEGPIGLICAPTRELSQQIYHEAKRFGKIYNIKVVCAYGGGNMWEQCKACEEGAEIVVCTPGRLIDLVKKKATNLRRVTYLVFDEADRMFDMGFEPQVRSIANHVRPNRQTLLFSATFKRRVERVCRDILTDPIRVIQGDIGEANEDVTQIVKIVHDGPSKWRWVKARLVEFTSSGSVLIFVTRKANSVELADNLKANDFKVGLMHGDMDQNTRNQVITAFKKKEMPVLIATDVAARGLDINHIRTVVNYDVARDIDTHTHRVGRTGRAGQKGTAYTLVTPKDKEFAGHLVRNLEGANQFVPPELIDLAMQISWFKNSRYKEQKVRKLNIGGQGLGFRERPGLGAGTSSSTNSSSLTNSYKSFQPAGESAGPQSERISSLKTAFSAQYQMNFIKGQRDTSKIEFTNPSLDSDAPLKKRKKKSRWD